MIRVALFAPWLITGGTQRHLQQVVRHLDRRRFSTHVFTLKAGGEVADELVRHGIPVECLDVGPGLLRPRALLAIARASRRLRSQGFDVLHGFQWRPALVGAIIGRLAGIPLLLAGKRSLTGEDPVARRAWRAIGRRVDTIVTNAAALRVEAEGDGVVARWEVIPSGVDVEHFASIPKRDVACVDLGLDPQRPVVGTVGRLEARKGHEVLLSAAHRLARDGRSPQLLIVGEGPMRSELARQAKEQGLADAVHLVGNLVDVRPALAAMDVFVLPSHAEGMSNALLEAMAAGRPVIATAVGGNVEALGGAGSLVDVGDAEQLAETIRAVLGGSAAVAAMVDRARRSVGERFGAAAMVARLQQVYEHRLAAHGRMAA